MTGKVQNWFDRWLGTIVLLGAAAAVTYTFACRFFWSVEAHEKYAATVKQELETKAPKADLATETSARVTADQDLHKTSNVVQEDMRESRRMLDALVCVSVDKGTIRPDGTCRTPAGTRIFRPARIQINP